MEESGNEYHPLHNKDGFNIHPDLPTQDEKYTRPCGLLKRI